MTKSVLKKLRRFAEQTRNGTELYDGNGLVQVGDTVTLMEWLDKNRYDETIFNEGVQLVQNVAKYRSLGTLRGESESKGWFSFWPGRRK